MIYRYYSSPHSSYKSMSVPRPTDIPIISENQEIQDDIEEYYKFLMQNLILDKNKLTEQWKLYSFYLEERYEPFFMQIIQDGMDF